MKPANFSWPGWGIITVSLGILGGLLPHSAMRVPAEEAKIEERSAAR